ncbi:AAA family ATPase [Streptomyces sp. KR55]|uniref:AAA family ATPase n=1 Tax=Streptomyces sp. KR55 TaxID=3457425 RepID=UPI003FD5FC93
MLLALGTATYQADMYERLEKVPDSLRTVVEALDKLGITSIAPPPGYHVDLGLDELCRQVGEAARAAPIVIVYYTGHGTRPPRGDYYLVLHAYQPGAYRSAVLPVRDLPELLLRRTADEELEADQPTVLVILDCCFSGSGGMDVLGEALKGIGNPNTWVLASAGGLQYAQQGTFAKAFSEALRHPRTGRSGRYVSLNDIVDVINTANPGIEQKARYFPPAETGSTGTELFFPNPTYVPDVARLTITDQHWISRLRGAPQETTTGFYLTGRNGRIKAAEDLATWMTGPQGGGLAVVTGSPGTGKSTLLSLPVQLVHDASRKQLLGSARRDPLIAQTAALLSTDLSVVAVHARGLNTDQAAREIAKGLGRDAETASALLEDLETSPLPAEPIVVVDAIDEATSPTTLLHSLLLRLARRHGLKVALGARRHVLRHIGTTDLTIDLDTEEYRDPQALIDYVHQLLTAAHEPEITTPYQDDSSTADGNLEEITASVAEAIARKATSTPARQRTAESFLLAQLLARAVRDRPEPVDTTDNNWQAQLPSSIGDAFDEDLERLGSKTPLARILLEALAWAVGPGLPWENLWVPVAEALAQERLGGHPQISDQDVRWLQEKAGAYIVEDLGPGQRSVFRPFHDLLAAHLRGEISAEQAAADSAALHIWQERQARTQEALTSALLSTVPTSASGQRQWLSAHPYLHTYLAQHAATAGTDILSALLHDADFLAVADPITLTPLLAPTKGWLPATARAYRRARPLLGDGPAANAAYLQEATHAVTGSTATADHTEVRPLYRTRLASVRRDDSLLTFTGHSGRAVLSVAFGTTAKDQPLLASADGDGTVRLWDPVRETPIGEPLTGHLGAVRSVAFDTTANGQLLLASGGDDGSVRLWDPVHVPPIGESLTGAVYEEVPGTAVKRQPLLTSADDDVLEVWDPVRRTRIGEWRVDQMYAVWSVAFGTTAKGQLLLASAHGDGTVQIWDPDRRSRSGQPLTGHAGAVWSVAFGTTAKGQLLLASGGDDGTVRLWDPVKRTRRKRLTGHRGAVRSVAFGTTAKGQLLLASGGDDGTVRLWDPGSRSRSGQPLTGHTHTGAVWSVVFGTTAKGELLLASGGDDETVRLWSPFSRSRIGKPNTGHLKAVRSLAFGTRAKGQPVLASGGDDGTVRLWDPASFNRLGKPSTGHTRAVGSVAFGTRAKGQPVLASGGDDGTVRLWDPEHGTPVGKPFTGHRGAVRSVAFGTRAKDQPVLASGGDDGTVRLWDPEHGTAVGDPLTGHRGAVLSVAFAPTAKGHFLLASCGRDGTVRLWRHPPGGRQVVPPITVHTGAVWSVAFGTTAKGQPLLAFGGDDGTVRLYNVVRRTEVMPPLAFHSGTVNSVAFGTTANGQLLLASAGNDGTVRLSDPVSQTSDMPQPAGHSGMVNSVAFGTTASGQPLLASAGNDGTVRLWDPATARCLETLRRRSPALSVAAAGHILAISDTEGVSVIELDR